MIEQINWKAYKEGYDRCVEVDGKRPEESLNPYEKDTDEWCSWNRGWNAYHPDRWHKKKCHSKSEFHDDCLNRPNSNCDGCEFYY